MEQGETSEHRELWTEHNEGTDIYQRLSKFAFSLLLIALLVAAYFLFKPQWQKQRLIDAEKASLVAELKELERKKAWLEDELRFLRGDSDYLELKARDRLDLHKEGEVVIRFQGR
jgi:cell division protein FtsB